jgi:CheY-like chemotaxis protein
VGIKILLADDSVTAQNIGKKILSEAGYEVVTVSNGAAAAKKIAELKPELVLLDVFMPGYSGLELCEKLRKAADTAKLPVLLTVGKLEPHSPQDVARVKADGVIIKPFEASDLTAAVERLAQKLKPAKPSVAEPEKASHPAEFKDETYLAWKQEAPAGAEESTPAVSAPKKPADAEYEKTMRLDPAQIAAMLKSPPETATPAPSAHLAPATEFSVAAPAHSMEEFSITSAASSSDPSPNSNLPAFDVAPVQAASSEIPSYMSQYFSEGSGTESAVPEAAPAPLEMIDASSTEEPAATVAFSKDSVVQHFEKPAEPQAEIAPAEGLELTAAAPVAEIPIAKEAGLEPTLQTVEATTFVIQDPALVTDPHSATMDFATQFGTGEPGLAEDLIQSMGSAAGEKVSTDDFEARLNAAMNAFAEPSAELPELMGANAGLPEAMVELPSLEAPAEAEPVSLESPIQEGRIEPEPLLEQLRAASLDPEIPKPGRPLATEITSSIIESETEEIHAVAESPVNEAVTEVSPVPDEAVAASPAAEEPAAIDAIASAFIGQAYPKTAANSMHEASAPETDEAVIRQMREAFSELPVDHSHLVEHSEAGPARMAMAAVAAVAPAVPSQIGHETELEIARALSAAVGAESSFDSGPASAKEADKSASDDANKMATAVENVMRRELPNLIWKIMAELDLSKRS